MPNEKMTVAYHWHCEDCGAEYKSPIPVISVRHECLKKPLGRRGRWMTVYSEMPEGEDA